jgi:hypothetical protein
VEVPLASRDRDYMAYPHGCAANKKNRLDKLRKKHGQVVNDIKQRSIYGQNDIARAGYRRPLDAAEEARHRKRHCFAHSEYPVSYNGRLLTPVQRTANEL